MFTKTVNGKFNWATLKITVALMAMLFFVIPGPGLLGMDISQASGGGWDDDGDENHGNHWWEKGPKFCSRTALAAFRAGKNEVKDDYWISVGNCNNLSEADDRAECLEDAMTEFKEGKELTRDQREARLEICESLGEAPYDPVIDPEKFVDFEAVVKEEETFTPNPYFPLVPGTVREYRVTEEGDEIEWIKVEVLDETKEIEGVNCIVVQDQVWEFDEDGEKILIEDTFDWYAQDVKGNVWYFGEISRNYEDGELVDLEGSWQAGRDGAKAGILMFANPEPGDLYRQEFALGDAEDMGEVIGYLDSLPTSDATYINPGEKYLQTKDFTPIEPSVFEYKYYAPGVGVVLEEAYEDGEPTGEIVELVSIENP